MLTAVHTCTRYGKGVIKNKKDRCTLLYIPAQKKGTKGVSKKYI